MTDVDKSFQRALEAGATSVSEVKDQFYGDRSGTLVDPFGHVWTIASHVEDVSADEMQKRIERIAFTTPSALAGLCRYRSSRYASRSAEERYRPASTGWRSTRICARTSSIHAAGCCAARAR